jgi:hypothetical protein
MSQLRNKILSYNPELYIPMTDTFTLVNPEMLGSILPTGTNYMVSTGQVPLSDTNGPIGAEQNSWLFGNTTSGQDGRMARMNSTNWSPGPIQDGLYGVGIWIKFNSFATGTRTYSFMQTTRLSGFPGGSFQITGTGSSLGFVFRHSFSSSARTITGITPELNKWYYFAVRKTRTSNNTKIYVDGVLVDTVSNTSFYTTYDNSYPWTFGYNTLLSGIDVMTYNMAHAHLFDPDVFTDAAIQEIYTAGSTPEATGYDVKYYNGTSWEPSLAQKYYDGNAWVDWNNISEPKRWDGTEWINLS